MPVTNDCVLKLCRELKGFDPHQNLSLADYLKTIPRLSSLADVPSGTPVLVRGDVDCKPGPEVGQEDIRLRSMRPRSSLAAARAGSRLFSAIWGASSRINRLDRWRKLRRGWDRF